MIEIFFTDRKISVPEKNPDSHRRQFFLTIDVFSVFSNILSFLRISFVGFLLLLLQDHLPNWYASKQASKTHNRYSSGGSLLKKCYSNIFVTNETKCNCQLLLPSLYKNSSLETFGSSL